ncbi:serine hydrolase [Clostridium uliginosum]|uniref:Beta-lactamase class A n=1 Tax=Clostridium uliginosum TaxID=119641 RepID=A0A1I1QQK4_9CLOT|nr:serine hydrolase [Clostridium uliginosum]SFD24329.1 beta-lactamase class A [Clostridium uliginosum]
MRITKKHFLIILILFFCLLTLLIYTFRSNSELKSIKSDNTTKLYNNVYENSRDDAASTIINTQALKKYLIPKKLNTGISLDKDLLNLDLTNEFKLSILHNNKYNLEDRISLYLGTDKENVGLIYYDLNSDEYINFNEDDIFVAASTYKVSLNVLTYERAKENKNLLNTTIKYEDKYYEEGTGVLQNLTDIPNMKIQDLLDLSIINSDNIATNMVGSYFGGHAQARKEVWNMFDVPISYSDNVTTPNAEFKILKHIYDNKDDINYAHLIKVLQSTDCHSRIDKYLPYDIVAHKVGSSNEYIHDIGLVLDKNPYILIIYTKDLDNPEEKIAQISKAIYEYQITEKEQT